MKEYINKTTGEYRKTADVVTGEQWIEVPKKAIFAVKNSINGVVHFVRKNGKFMADYHVKNNDIYWCKLSSGYLKKDYVTTIWQRHTQPEELPFIDDEPEIELRGYDQWIGSHKLTDDAYLIQVGGNHYKNLAIQPVEFAMKNNLDFCQANAIKYIVRHANKNGKQDLEKAKHYIDLLIQNYYSED